MNDIRKAATVKALELNDGELVLINRQAIRPLSAEEVFAFRVAACDDQVDRDFERFTPAALEGLAKLYVGKPLLSDHDWSAGKQAARVYAASVEEEGGGHRLVLRAYMLRSDITAPSIAAIEGGILREVSVGCAMGKAVCSICGTDRMEKFCGHIPGKEYDGEVCHIDLDDPRDAYECSFVAVPAQPMAGVIKRYGGEGEPREDGDPGPEAEEEEALRLARAKQEQEEKRYGGIEV